MSTATTERKHTGSTVVLFSADQMHTGVQPKMHFKKGEDENQVLVLSDVPVFRSGTFRDSMGYQMTWEDIHVDQMVAHFDMLRNRNIFSDIPVRDGHPGFLVSGQAGNGKVIGYHTAIRAEKRTSTHDNQEYTYLLAEYEILDPEAQRAIQSGLWRNRSAEVGRYVTNAEAEFWPVYQGVAYVDIPAVEGLNGFSKENGNVRFMMEEESMSTSLVTPTAPVAPTPPTAPAAPTTDTAAHAAPVAPETPAAPAAHTFSIGGQQTQDFGAVQAHITKLETENAAFARAAQEADELARTEFVNGLVTSNKLLATQLDGTLAFAKTLNQEQFAAWKATQEGTPTQPLLGQYGGTQPTAPAVTGQVDTAAQHAATLEAVVRQHARSGMSRDKIVQLGSYKELLTINPAFKL
jgi:hypothetical protein